MRKDYLAYVKIEEENLLLTNYIVLWIDILGQKKELSKFDKPLNLLLHEQGNEAFIKNVESTFLKVKDFRDIIQTFLKGFKDEWEKIYKNNDNPPQIGVQFNSDSAILKIPFINSTSETGKTELSKLINQFMDSLNILIHVMSGTMLTFFSEGIFTRGAISFGVCAELNENDLYGAGVADAYEYEDRYANYPRIVITENLNRAIKYYCDIYRNNQDDFTDNQKQSLRNRISYFKEIFIPDCDGITILSYLDGLKNLENVKKEAIIKSYQFIEEQIKKHKEHKNIKLRVCQFKCVNGIFQHITVPRTESDPQRGSRTDSMPVSRLV